MDYEHAIITFDDDELEEVPSAVSPSHQVTRWVIVDLEPRHDLLERVRDVFISNTVASRRGQDLH